MSDLAPAAERFAERYDTIMLQPWMLEFYEQSGYYNTGYAPDAGTAQAAACKELVARLAARLPSPPAHILDAGCGLGAVTRDLAALFPAAEIVGINVSREQLARCRAESARVSFAAMDAAALQFDDRSFDAVFSVEAAFHFDTRAAFLAEQHRVLRPGGTLVLSDILFADPDAIGDWMVPPANRITTIADYDAALRRAGFTNIRIEDETDACWRAFVGRMAQRLDQRYMPGELLRRLERCVAHYVLVWAERGAA